MIYFLIKIRTKNHIGRKVKKVKMNKENSNNTGIAGTGLSWDTIIIRW